MERAWVAVVLNRINAAYAVTMDRLCELVPDPQQPSAMRSKAFRKAISVYGHYDIIVAVESQDAEPGQAAVPGLQQINRAINTITSTAQGGILYTRTYIAAETWSKGENRFEGRQIPIGICVEAGTREVTRDALVARGMFDVVDVVFGDFDLIALLTPHDPLPVHIREMLRVAPHITRTTTMIPGSLLHEHPNDRTNPPASARS